MVKVNLDDSCIKYFRKHLLQWFDQFGRHDLPWQLDITPYKVWLSEIMLQQTQVQTVIPYYEKFLASFPTLQALATAELDDVLSHWAGLGYYRRAKFLHQCAQTVMQQHQGELPQQLDALVKLPGIGPSTAGAVLSLSMQQRGVILDGNVKRVLSRFFAIQEPLNESKGMKHLWHIAEQLTPNKRNNHFNQAMMDMGATCCTRSKPNCSDCPLQLKCLAYAEGIPEQYPIRPIKTKTKPKRSTVMLILVNQHQQILMYKRPSDGIWPQLYSFPEIDMDATSKLKQITKKHWGLTLIDFETIKPFSHQFTHFTLQITPIICYTNQPKEQAFHNNMNPAWYHITQAHELGIPAPVKKILKHLPLEALV